MAKQEEIKIKGVPRQLKADIKLIAKNMGINMGDLIKPKLHEIRDNAAPHLKIDRGD